MPVDGRSSLGDGVPASSAQRASEHVRTEVRGALGVVTLDRQRALNALTLEMVQAVADALRRFADDARVERVAITGAGERALCAGGDVVHLVDDVRSNGGAGSIRFWSDEYRLNAAIARFQKPVVAIQHGIVLGGGVGISGHASHRIVTDSTRIGFPEVTIGFVPDVGATWLLTRRPGELGTRAALTGEHFGAADAILLGLADTYVPEARLPELLALLESTEPDEAIGRVAAHSPDGRLAGERAIVDAAFAGGDAADALARLDASGPEGERIAATIRTRSPYAVALTLEALRRARELPNLETALVQEYRVSRHTSQRPDFAEGVRAQLVDEDGAPKWQPPSLDEVAPGMVEASFAAPSEGDLQLPARPHQEETA